MNKMMTRVLGVVAVLGCLAQVGCVSSFGGNIAEGDSVPSMFAPRSKDAVVVERHSGASYERRELRIDASVPAECRQAMINKFLRSESPLMPVSDPVAANR